MKQRENILTKMASAVDLDAEPIPKLPLIEIAGHCRVLIENHLGVTQYGTEEIGVKVQYGYIQIIGSGLKLARMTKEQLVVTGNIGGVHLCKGRK